MAGGEVGPADFQLELQRSPETSETLLWGVGQAHIEVTVERMKRKSGLDIVLTVPKVPYHETITAARGWWQFPVGGGIVAQSSPDREYEETWHKAEGLLRALS